MYKLLCMLSKFIHFYMNLMAEIIKYFFLSDICDKNSKKQYVF